MLALWTGLIRVAKRPPLGAIVPSLNLMACVTPKYENATVFKTKVINKEIKEIFEKARPWFLRSSPEKGFVI